MLIYYSAIAGTTLISKISPQQKIIVQELKLNPETGQILGVILNNKGEGIAVDQIIEWQPRLKIDGKIVLKPLEGISIYGLPVETASKKLIGKVVDLTFDDVILTLRSIVTEKGFFLVHFDKRVIGRPEIVRITEKKIIIKDDLLLQKLPAAARLFRKRAEEITAEPA